MIRLIFNKLSWVSSVQFGINPSLFLKALYALPRYLSDYIQFKKNHTGRITFIPCLHDRLEEGGITKSEYFWQDLLVARWIYEEKPKRHVDVGSRIDGFVAHVASFREVEVFDVRPVTTSIPSIVFRKADLMDSASIGFFTSEKGYCDSLSCLHALEHFGLGRYGDTINPQGYKKGLENMARLLLSSGKFYLSTPIGIERVEFNAGWVFDPRNIIATSQSYGLKLEKLTVIDNSGIVHDYIEFHDELLKELAQQNYNLGIFTFIKSN